MCLIRVAFLINHNHEWRSESCKIASIDAEHGHVLQPSSTHSLVAVLFLFLSFSYAIRSHFEEFGMVKLNKLLLFHVEFHTPTALDCQKTNFTWNWNARAKVCCTFVIFHLREERKKALARHNQTKITLKVYNIERFPPCDFLSTSRCTCNAE